MRKFFFDMKDGVTVRDRIGKDFATRAEAIEHGKLLAERFRSDTEPDLRISIVNENGAEVHSEPVHPDVYFSD